MRPFAWTVSVEPFVKWAWIPTYGGVSNSRTLHWLCFYFARVWDHMSKGAGGWGHK